MKLHPISSVAFGAGAFVVAGAIAVLVLSHGHSSGAAPREPSADAEPAPEESAAAHLAGPTLVVQVSPAQRADLKIETTPARLDQRPQLLHLSATTALDSDTVAHVHARFAGQAMDVPVRLGQRVTKGQPLTNVWSKDLGEKKSEYIDARSQFQLSQVVLDRLKATYDKGAIPEKTYLQAVRDAEAARIAMDRAYRTLISWRLSKEEIDHIAREDDADWPRDVVRAPGDGMIVEKNVVPGELVDPSANLFVIADLSHIAVWAYAFEEDLPRLRVGQPWTVTVPALPGRPLTGTIRVVGAVVDPTQHTATVQGVVANPGEQLRGGMFATAEVTLPAGPGQVVVPTTALVDADNQTVVYVQTPQKPGEFTRRLVRVRERLVNEAVIAEGLHPGEAVVSRGALELNQLALADTAQSDD